MGSNPGTTVNLAGGAFVSSSDGSIDVEGGPAQGQVDLKVAGGAVLRTLAAIYAFGVGDAPTVDNIFAMPTGTMRFQSTAPGTAFAFPAIGWWEHVTPAIPGDGRAGVWLATRYQFAGAQVSTFNADQIYNAVYAGTLVDGTEWTRAKGLLTSSLSQATQTGDDYWRHVYFGAAFFNNQPLANPYSGAAGTVVYNQDQLHATGLVTVGRRLAREVSGWGQQFNYLLPQQHGITPALIGMYTDTDVAGAAGDGTGLWFMYGDPAHRDTSKARGGYEAAMLTASPNGAWGLNLRAYDGAGNFNVVAHFDNTGATANGAHVVTGNLYTVETPVFDWTVAADVAFSVLPAPPAGFYPVVVSIRTLLTQQAGTLTTSPTWQIGNNATFSNMIPSNTPNMTANIGQAPCLYAGASAGASGGLVLLDATNPIKARITVGATGVGFSAHGKVVIVFTLIPLV